MKKKLFLIVCLCFSVSVFAQKVGVLTGPSGLPCSFLMEEKYCEFEVFPSAQNLVPKLLKEEIDFAFLPPNLAAKIYNSSKKIKLLGITGNGNLYLISKDKSIDSLKDLNGKKVSSSGMNATPEYIMKSIFKKLNIDCELDFSIPTPQIPVMFNVGKIETAIIPEPFVTSCILQNCEISSIIDIQKEYEAIFHRDFPMTVLVVTQSYLKNHQKQVELFINEYKKAQKKALASPAECGILAEKHNLGIKSLVAEKAIPNCSYTWKDSKNAKSEIEELLTLFMSFDSSSIGGKLPDDNFYYKVN